jgi:OmpA-OmpF porin, OOP family
MSRVQRRFLLPVIFAAFVISLSAAAFAQDNANAAQSRTNTVQVPAGQKMDVEGVILSQQPNSLTLRSTGGATYNVTYTPGIDIKEKKGNPFRGAKRYSKSDLVPGLQVEVKGTADNSGAIAAREIKMRNDDFIVAQTMDTRVVPVENTLNETRSRLSETEQNAQRLSGQVQELSAVSNAARGGAKAAQETADNALNRANNASTAAENARAGVRAANERITSLDDYDIKSTTTVHFKVGSSMLSNEEKAELEKIAEQTKGEKGFVIEVTGFASSDGGEAVNRRLSQKRADAVIQYLAYNYSIPLRRFVMPMGYGEKQPVADNQSRSGRKENRRVEVRILVSKGITTPENAVAPESNPSTNMPTSNQQQQ